MSEHTIGIMIAMAVYGAVVSVIAFYKSLKIQGLRADLKHVEKLNKELIEDLNHTKADAFERINLLTGYNQDLRIELHKAKPKRDKSGKFAPKNESAQVKLPKGVKRFNIDGTKSKGDDRSFVVKIDSENALLSFVAGATHQGYKMLSGEKPEWLLKNFDMHKNVLFVGKKHRVVIVTSNKKVDIDYILFRDGSLGKWSKHPGYVGFTVSAIKTKAVEFPEQEKSEPENTKEPVDYLLRSDGTVTTGMDLMGHYPGLGISADDVEKRAVESKPENAKEPTKELWGGELSSNSEQPKPRPISGLKPNEAIQVNNDAERDAILKLMEDECLVWMSGSLPAAYTPNTFPDWIGLSEGRIVHRCDRREHILPASDFLPTEPKAEQTTETDPMPQPDKP